MEFRQLYKLASDIPQGWIENELKFSNLARIARVSTIIQRLSLALVRVEVVPAASLLSYHQGRNLASIIMPLLTNHWLVAGGVFSWISRLCKCVRIYLGGQYIAINVPILLRSAFSRKWIYSIIRIIVLREEIQFTLVIAISQLLLPLGDIPSHSIIYNVLVNQFFNTTIFIKSKSTNVCLIWGGPMKSGNRITWPLGRKISDRNSRTGVSRGQFPYTYIIQFNCI